jgi:hypothetical protein
MIKSGGLLIHNDSWVSGPAEKGFGGNAILGLPVKYLLHFPGLDYPLSPLTIVK